MEGGEGADLDLLGGNEPVTFLLQTSFSQVAMILFTHIRKYSFTAWVNVDFQVTALKSYQSLGPVQSFPLSQHFTGQLQSNTDASKSWYGWYQSTAPSCSCSSECVLLGQIPHTAPDRRPLDSSGHLLPITAVPPGAYSRSALQTSVADLLLTPVSRQSPAHARSFPTYP